MVQTASPPLTDPVAEAQRLLAGAERRGLSLRLMGGLAIRLRTKITAMAPFQRSYEDIDFACARADLPHLADFFGEMGYLPNDPFNAAVGQVRQMYLDSQTGRHVDLFVGKLAMCHQIALEARLPAEQETLPLAELVLSKLQVVELNLKDALDVAALFAEYPVLDRDSGAVNGRRIAELCAGDWGLWRTVRGNLERVGLLLRSWSLAPDVEERIAMGLRKLLDRIDEQPKSLAWRLRSLVGERVRWYELPEEVG